MRLPRRSGILLHITSLPGGPFSGDLGQSAYGFADFLADARQAWWQTLPLNPIGDQSSPYSSLSSFAGEPLLISPERLIEDGLLDKQLLREVPTTSGSWGSSFARSKRLRAKLLRHAYRSFLDQRPKSMLRSFAAFKVREKAWLDDYCLFGALSNHFETLDWTRWPKGIAGRANASLRSARVELEHRIDYLAFQQFVFDRQWRALRTYCRKKGVGIIGDLPMFVAHDSCDVWAHQRAFLLNAKGLPKFVAGAPPDSFNANGQRWGNPLYDWAYHQRTGFAWWTQRVQRQLDLFDMVRLDHFIGFSRYWRIPNKAKTAKSGRWVPARGRQLFDELVRVHGKLPFIAEDLGAVTKEVWDLRDRYGLPGIKVLQFAFGSGAGARVHRPHDYPNQSVAFTGTHDNDTTRGWYKALKRRARSRDQSARAELRRVHAYLGTDEEAEVAQAAMRALSTSPADTVIFPLQDVLSLDGKHRMNAPGTTQGNWMWRLKDGQLDADVSARLRDLVEATDRCSGP
ncbi:MAG: 4-alpha-glucanotransferase [Myxococcales bacterium]|nr:4-alpha-glucanotransferase [Myxococcales bacterium]MDH3483225.1 4-alpha-glucanotransferase [Myxococcales bacterium]